MRLIVGGIGMEISLNSGNGEKTGIRVGVVNKVFVPI